ncbi:hypothetical protein F5Y09DRAFT_347651 [Xylaria sp. FL1042]|nr:hypothetical protein F5Y09DRAFT_347651 [Xylaria sp. FL1042]
MSSQQIENVVTEVEQLLDILDDGSRDVDQLKNDLEQSAERTKDKGYSLHSRRDDIRNEIDQLVLQKMQLAEQIALLKNNAGKFDMVKCQRVAESIHQAQFDNALHWIVVMEKGEVLDRLRGMSPDHKAAILNLEQQITVEKLDKVEESLRQKDKELSNLSHQLPCQNGANWVLENVKNSLETRLTNLKASELSAQDTIRNLRERSEEL